MDGIRRTGAGVYQVHQRWTGGSRGPARALLRPLHGKCEAAHEALIRLVDTVRPMAVKSKSGTSNRPHNASTAAAGSTSRGSSPPGKKKTVGAPRARKGQNGKGF